MENDRSSALVLFAHGARDPGWREPFENIRRRVAARLPAATVELAFLEIMQPALDDAIAALAREGCTRITIAPIFMAQGSHLKRDLPKLVEGLRSRFPGVLLKLLPAVGEVDPVLDAIGDWLVNSLQSDPPRSMKG